MQYTLIIPETFANERLDQALARLMPEYSRTQIKTWIQAGKVLVGDKLSKANMRLKGGELISVEVMLRPESAWEAEAIPLSIIYEDEALLLINKPIGLVVHPGTGNKNSTLLNALLHYLPQLKNIPRAGILHRLDKDTSGLLMVAKTQEALKNLSHQLKKRTLLREYQAIVVGTLISGGLVQAPIARHPMQRKRMAVIETGKPAITHYRVAEKYRSHTRLKIRLETGRTHQIRVHMAHLHHPIVGDPVYGGRLQLTKGMLPDLIQQLRSFKHQALHAYSLGFEHPKTQEWMQFEVELPEDMKKLITLLRADQDENKK